jgi:hypothetical protein
VPSEVLFRVFEARDKAAPPSLTYCGDNQTGKKMAATLIRDVGFDPIDVGPLRMARHTEALAVLVRDPRLLILQLFDVAHVEHAARCDLSLLQDFLRVAGNSLSRRGQKECLWSKVLSDTGSKISTCGKLR